MLGLLQLTSRLDLLVDEATLVEVGFELAVLHAGRDPSNVDGTLSYEEELLPCGKCLLETLLCSLGSYVLWSDVESNTRF